MPTNTAPLDQKHPSNIDPSSIPPARKENGDTEGDGNGGEDVVGSPNDPVSDPKKPSTAP
ncbi:hypothetical protein [Robbsia sp. KACC 23696]|uniref:hypothetical protein n=1 Tax=Robbsia sp. KACC 23696 TaxID=3149231 RepID=UPI00325A4FE8